MIPLSDTTAVMRPGVIELAVGHPDPALLPLDALREAAADTFAQYGTEPLNYGLGAGPGPLLDWLRARFAACEGRAIPIDQIMLTGGNSHALDQLLTLHTRPGDVALVESPVYHLALGILRDHGLECMPVAFAADDTEASAMADALATLHKAGKHATVFYCVPTFNNPTGQSWPVARRAAVVEMAAREGCLILEDDVYRELAYEAAAPASLWSIAPPGVVARMGSFSKTLAAGLRVGWLTASPALVARQLAGGLLSSGGGVNQFATLVTMAFCLGGGYDAQLAVFKQAYQARRDALLAALAEFCPGCQAQTPQGGFFVWLRLPAGVDGVGVAQRALAAGVSCVPGPAFDAGNGVAVAGYVRLCFALYPPETLREGARRLARAIG